MYEIKKGEEHSPMHCLLFHEAFDEDKFLKGSQCLIPVASHLLIPIFGICTRRQL